MGGVTLVCLNAYVLVHASNTMNYVPFGASTGGNHIGVSSLAVTAVLLFVKDIVNYMTCFLLIHSMCKLWNDIFIHSKSSIMASYLRF